MNILRITRHSATTEQLAALNHLFGVNARVVEVDFRFSIDPRQAVQEFDRLAQEHQANVIEVVLPLHLLDAIMRYSQFVQGGGMIIRAIMDSPAPDTFVFSHYEQVISVRVETRRLD